MRGKFFCFFFNLSALYILSITISKVFSFDLALHQNSNLNSNPKEEYQHLLWRTQLELLTKIDGSKSTQCTHLNFVFDSNMFQKAHNRNINKYYYSNDFNFENVINLNSNPYVNNHNNNNVLENVFASTLILNLNPDRNAERDCTDEDITTPRINPHCSPLTQIYFNTKYIDHSCSLIVMRLTVDHNMETLVENYRLWTFTKLPGYYFQNFYLFLVQKNENKLPMSKKVEEVAKSSLADYDDQFDFLSNFSMVTRKLTNALFFMENGGMLLARQTNYQASLYSIGSIKKNHQGSPAVILNDDRLGLYKSGKKFRDFEKNSILGIVCPICEPDYEEFKRTGIFSDYIIASFYETSLLFNATLELEAAFSIPKDGLDENGNWDSFVAPVMEGTAIVSGIVRRSPINVKYVLMTKPVFYDVVIFMTARPKRVKFGSLAVLQKPLSVFVWLWIFISISIIFLTVELIIYIKRRRVFHFRFSGLRRISKHAHYLTLLSLLDPLVDQNGLVSKTFTKNIEDSISRSIIALWFLSLIVLGCAYKSKLFALMVLPHYEESPTNWPELINSAYGIGTLFWSNQIECQFNSLASNAKNNKNSNDSLSKRLGGRIQEFEYFNGDCYQYIFEGKNVCVGYGKILETVAVDFITDVKGRSMARKSKDTFFAITAGIVVNREYAEFFAPLQFVTNALESTGIFEHCYQRGLRQRHAKGKLNAKNWLAEKPYYKGHDDKEDMESGSSRQFAWVLAQLILLGCGFAIISGLIEIIYPWRMNRRGDEVVPFTQ